MTIIGFTFTKLMVERTGKVEGELKIDNNVRLSDVQELKLPGQKDKGLKMNFEYISKYEPGVGNLKFEGNLVELLSIEDHKEAVDAWKKEKAVSNELMKRFINAVFRRCLIQAMIVGREVNLPPPVRLPRLKDDAEFVKNE